VRLENISYPYFLGLSLALHFALVPLLWRKPLSTTPVFESISVSFLPDTKPLEKSPTAPPLPAQRRGEPQRGKPLKRAPTIERNAALPPRQSQPQVVEAPASPEAPPRPGQNTPPAVVDLEPQKDMSTASRAPAQGQASIFKNDGAETPISKTDLLPGRRDLIGIHRAIPLNTSDMRYAPYTQTVKQWIESRWEYPDLAKHYGLQGRVVVEFTILQNGNIELLALVRSSGSKLLDEEAVRAIKAAVPFKPFPRSIQENSLRIIAGFVYSDQRLRVGDAQ
jgi:protein TonB